MAIIHINLQDYGVVAFLSESANTPFTSLLRSVIGNYNERNQEKLVASLLGEMANSATPSVVLSKYMSVHGVARS